MQNMRSADLRAALDFVEKIGAATDLDAFAATLLTELDKVISADVVAYNEVNPADDRASFVANPAEAIPRDGKTILERHMHENPLVEHSARTRDGRAVKWSDFISRRQLHSTGLWNGLFRPIGVEHQMVAVLPAPAPLLVGVVLHRTGRDFTERDRTLLNVLRPHLIRAYRNSQANSALAARVAASGTRHEVVVLGVLGEPLSESPGARKLLAAFGHAPAGRLPERVVEWRRRMERRRPLPPEPLVVTSEGHRVEARISSPSILVFRAETRGAEADTPLDPSDLRALELAPREREVLALIAKGHTNKRVAARLGVKPATVKKHLERIYGKLGVRTRTAAAAEAFRAAGPLGCGDGSP